MRTVGTLDIRTLTIEKHAIMRAKQRFGQKGKEQALEFCKRALECSEYIGETASTKGYGYSQMFVSKEYGVIVYLSTDFKSIKTLMKVDKNKSYIVYDRETVQEHDKKHNANIVPLQDKLLALYKEEFQRYGEIEKEVAATLETLEAGDTEEMQRRQEELKSILDIKRQISKTLATLL